MVNEGVTPPDYGSTVGQVRVLIGDTDAIDLVPPVTGQGEYSWYSDDELMGLLTVFSDNVRRAAAQALRTVAASQALLLKKWSADDLSVDGARVAQVLRELADSLDEQADNADAALDIFQISYPGANREFVPEGMPVPIGRLLVPGAAFGSEDGWTVDGDGYIVG